MVIHYVEFHMLCRVCKQTYRKKFLRTPCLCSGDEQYIHTYCIDSLECTKCGYHYQFSWVYTWNNYIFWDNTFYTLYGLAFLIMIPNSIYLLKIYFYNGRYDNDYLIRFLSFFDIFAVLGNYELFMFNKNKEKYGTIMIIITYIVESLLSLHILHLYTAAKIRNFVIPCLYYLYLVIGGYHIISNELIDIYAQKKSEYVSKARSKVENIYKKIE